nr:tryptophan-rich sensory protein [Nocardia sp. BSTN01]
MWTALYVDIAATTARALTHAEPSRNRALRNALLLNLTLNASWSGVFFRAHRLGACHRRGGRPDGEQRRSHPPHGRGRPRRLPARRLSGVVRLRYRTERCTLAPKRSAVVNNRPADVPAVTVRRTSARVPSIELSGDPGVIAELRRDKGRWRCTDRRPPRPGCR